jgi:hypothetical protein
MFELRRLESATPITRINSVANSLKSRVFYQERATGASTADVDPSALYP